MGSKFIALLDAALHQKFHRALRDVGDREGLENTEP